jgi:hypothetical protein
MALGIHWSIHIKKISAAWEKSVATAGGEEGVKRHTDPFNAEETENSAGNDVVKTHFGDELLYACYQFYDRFKHKPASWLEVFDFLRFMKVQGILRDIAMSNARTGEDG